MRDSSKIWPFFQNVRTNSDSTYWGLSFKSSFSFIGPSRILLFTPLYSAHFSLFMSQVSTRLEFQVKCGKFFKMFLLTQVCLRQRMLQTDFAKCLVPQ